MTTINQTDLKTRPEDFKLVWQPDALPHEPARQGKQFGFLSAGEDYVDLDGGKGSGKSDLLIFDCIRPEKLLNPQWHGVIFRREYKRLTEMIDRAKHWFSKLPQLGAHWQGDQNRFLFPSGAWLGFHNVENKGDEEKYQGWQICDLKFDQLEEFEESMFDYLVLQNRTGDAKLKPTVRWTANPGGVGHAWVKRRFIDGKNPGKVHTIVTKHNGREYVVTYRRIFATVFDNPLLRHDETYIAKLASDPDPIRRKAMFEGDWNIVRGQFFSEFSTLAHIIPSRELPVEWERAVGLDYGNVKVMEFLARDYEGNVYVENEFRLAPTEDRPNGFTASEFAERSAKFMIDRKIGDTLTVVGDNNMWSATGRDVGSDKTPVRIIQEKWDEMFEAEGRKSPTIIKVSKRSTEEYNYRVACNEALRDYLRYEVNEQGKIVREPRIFILDRVMSLPLTLPTLVADPNDPLDIADKQDDHDYDALKMPFMQIMATFDRVKPPRQFKDYDEFMRETVLKPLQDKVFSKKLKGWDKR